MKIETFNKAKKLLSAIDALECVINKDCGNVRVDFHVCDTTQFDHIQERIRKHAVQVCKEEKAKLEKEFSKL